MSPGIEPTRPQHLSLSFVESVEIVQAFAFDSPSGSPEASREE